MPFLHAPLPSHTVSPPPSGQPLPGEPAAWLTQVPPAPVHALQVPQLATPQQWPSTQWPLEHCGLAVQVAPLPATQLPAGGAPWHVSPAPHAPTAPHEQLLDKHSFVVVGSVAWQLFVHEPQNW